MAAYYDEIEIEDMAWDEEKGVFHYPCPCGDRFEITRKQLANYEDIATCPSCSLIIRVIYDPVRDFLQLSIGLFRVWVVQMMTDWAISLSSCLSLTLKTNPLTTMMVSPRVRRNRRMAVMSIVMKRVALSRMRWRISRSRTSRGLLLLRHNTSR
jgi:diphthamide biosynthesis protein 3